MQYKTIKSRGESRNLCNLVKLKMKEKLNCVAMLTRVNKTKNFFAAAAACVCIVLRITKDERNQVSSSFSSENSRKSISKE